MAIGENAEQCYFLLSAVDYSPAAPQIILLVHPIYHILE